MLKVLRGSAGWQPTLRKRMTLTQILEGFYTGRHALRKPITSSALRCGGRAPPFNRAFKDLRLRFGLLSE
jgi:hypothetical protein